MEKLDLFFVFVSICLFCGDVFSMYIKPKPVLRPSPLCHVEYAQLVYFDGVNKLDGTCDGPLHRAIRQGITENIIFLFNHGANLELQNKDGLTPLKLAILCYCQDLGGDFERRYKIVETLLSLKADPNYGGRETEHFIRLKACFLKEKSEIEKDCSIDVYMREHIVKMKKNGLDKLQYDFTAPPLIFFTKVFQKILLGSYELALRNLDGSRYRLLVKLLLKYLANPNQEDSFGRVAISYACDKQLMVLLEFNVFCIRCSYLDGEKK